MKTLLIVGCGDVVRRALPWLIKRARVLAVVRDAARAAELRALGVTPIRADLDDAASLRRIASLADWVIHSAPPPDTGTTDPRTKRLMAALRRPRPADAHSAETLGSVSLSWALRHPQRRPAPRFCYISTSGVYGDCHGAWVPETRPTEPATARGKRRVDAEERVRSLAKRPRRASFVVHRAAARLNRRPAHRVSILRAPGIYAADRLPLERLRRGDPVLRAVDDVFTNHIHAEDLAVLTLRALLFGRGGRVFNAADDSQIKMGDYFELVADAFNLPRPPRLARAEAALRLSPMTLSFMSESRRLDNTRIKRELKMRLRYPSVAEGLSEAAAQLHAACDTAPDAAPKKSTLKI